MISFHLHAAGDHGDGHGTIKSIGERGNSLDVTRTVEIKMFDNYYEPQEITINSEQTVRFVVHNVGEIVHEFNIATP